MKKQNYLKKQKISFFVSSFAFFKEVQKQYIEYQNSILRVDINRYFRYLCIYKILFSIWMKSSTNLFRESSGNSRFNSVQIFCKMHLCLLNLLFFDNGPFNWCSLNHDLKPFWNIYFFSVLVRAAAAAWFTLIGFLSSTCKGINICCLIYCLLI